MTNIELSFINGSVNMPIDNILSITNKNWVLSDILNAHINNYDTKIIKINEDKHLVLSLIDSIRYNTVFLSNNNIDANLLLDLAKKWRVPYNIVNLIENYLNKNNNNKINLLLNLLVFQCINCKMGFKFYENTKDSCICHPKNLNHISHKFECCGKYSGESPCSKGYHCLSSIDEEKVINFLKEKNEIF